MSALARWMARQLWWGMLRFMRQPWVRRMRRTWLRRVPAPAARRLIQQDRFARRHGQAILTFSLTLMLGSFAITGCYFLALAFFHSGLLQAGR
jgi:hypothetical protein